MCTFGALLTTAAGPPSTAVELGTTGSVDGQAIAEVVANWTGIPVGRMLADEVKTVLSLRHRDELEWETIRWPGETGKMMFHPRPERPTEPNAGILRLAPGAHHPVHLS